MSNRIGTLSTSSTKIKSIATKKLMAKKLTTARGFGVGLEDGELVES
jgi:hypothetical protein